MGKRTSREVETLVCNLYQTDDMSVANIAEESGISSVTVWRILKRRGISRDRKHGPRNLLRCNDQYFNKLTKESAYWLGFITADGCVSQGGSGSWHLSIRLSGKDKEHLANFKRDIESGHKLREGVTKNGHPYCAISISRKELVDDLKGWGVIPNKTKHLQAPDLPENLYHHYLRGFFEGDGSFYLRKKAVTPQLVFALRSSTESYLLHVKDKIQQNVGVSLGKVCSDSVANAYSLQCEGNVKTRRIFNWLYAEATRYLPRKYKLASDHLNSL
jgi:intein-encoded DNA endonuclease-like protein